MAITLRHDAFGVVPPSNAATRKYGQNLVLQQQQQKYAGQQAGYDRLFDAYKQQNQNAFAFNQAADNRVFQANQQQAQNNFLMGRDKAQLDQQQQAAEAERQRAFLDDARKQQSGFIMEGIKNGEYDPATSRKLQQNLVAESEALGNGSLDATQRAEALQKILAERALLTANRMEQPPKPTPQQQFDQGIVVGPDGAKYRANSKGDFEPLPVQPTQPASAAEALKANPKLQSDYRNQAAGILAGPDGDKAIPGSTPEEQRAAVNALAMKLYEQDQKDFGGSQAAAQAPPVAEQVPSAPAGIPIAPPDPGQPPAPAPVTGLGPNTGVPELDANGNLAGPAPGNQREPLPLTSNSTSQQEPPPASSQQQVKVDGKPLAVTPGTLTPQETAARSQIMKLPREQRISALMPYDPELKGKTLEQLLEDPETKAGYEEMTKQGLTTGNYREDMLGHIDEMLQHNVLNAAGQSPPSAYAGMRADEVTDPKAKAEVDKMPRPKTADEMKAVRGKYFIDPNGIIRGTQKQA